MANETQGHHRVGTHLLLLWHTFRQMLPLLQHGQAAEPRDSAVCCTCAPTQKDLLQRGEVARMGAAACLTSDSGRGASGR
jgi:hypothetical protein